MQPEIGKQELFEFIVKLGVFAAMEMNWPEFNVLNQTACALLEKDGLLDEFREFSKKEMKIPPAIMPVGRC